MKTPDTLSHTAPPQSAVPATVPIPTDDKADLHPERDLDDELLPEYDNTMLKNGIRGKHAARITQGVSTHISGVRTVALPADLDAAFPTDQKLFAALREHILAQQNNSAA